jgi:cobalt-zinc-cadmium efflux system outer membrane protein
MESLPLRRALVIATATALSGCATVPRERGLSEIHALVDQRSGGEHTWTTDRDTQARTAAQIHTIVSQPLSADAAVQIALLHNPRMQSEYARLGIAQADVYEASRISNPTLSITALHHSGEPTKFDGGLTANFAELLMLPARKRLAAGEYTRTQESIGAAILNLAADTRAAWYAYVSAQQVAAMRTAVATAAQTSADLAAKFFEAGNISVLQCKLEEAAATQARLQATRAKADATRARSALNALMGLSAEAAQWTAAGRLPAPLGQDESADMLVPLAHQQRLDLAAAQKQVTLLEQSLDVTKRYRLLGKVDVGVAGERETDRTKLYGPSLSLQLPIFNQGQGAVARAGAMLDERRARVQSLELEIDNTVVLGIDRVATTRKIAEDYRAALIPQRETIVARTQEQQNYMLIGVFELLLAKQQEFDAYQGYLEAVRDYWLARVDLMRAVGAHLPSEGASSESTVGPDEILHPPSDASTPHDHHGGTNMPGMDMSGGAPAPGQAPPPTKNGPKPKSAHSHDMSDMPGMKMPPVPAPEHKGDTHPKDTDTKDSGNHDQHGDAP